MKWVFKIKDDGLYRYRLVSKGYLQKEGVEYDLSHSPVRSCNSYSHSQLREYRSA